jgi:hypothetical protein
MEAKISAVDSIASAMSAYEFPNTPAIAFTIAKHVLPSMLKTTVRMAVCS